MTNEIKPHKVLSPAEMSDTLASVADIQAEILLHIRLWLHQPTPELDARYTAARQSEATMLEQVMAFDRRAWRKAEAEAEAEALKAAEAIVDKRKRRRAEQAVRRRYHSAAPSGSALRSDDQLEGDGL
jgi:hypothetical protein